MALAILDGTQTATTLSTILSSGQHITAHTVVSLGTQAITDILNATSAGLTNTQLRASAVTIGGTVTVGNSLTISSLPAISGTVTANGLTIGGTIANVFPIGVGTLFSGVQAVADVIGYRLPISLGDSQVVVTASLNNSIPEGTNRIGVVTIGAGTVTIGAGTAQIGSVTASISNFPATQPISISSVTVGNSVTIGSLPDFIGGGYNNLFNLGDDGNLFVQANVTNLPSIPAGTNQIGTVTANTFAVQGTAVTTSNFTSTTASTVLANYNATREVLTIFNEGAGNLHIAPGATCTTVQYQVRLSSGDYYEVPSHQTTITHSAVFATAGTARICQLS
jgi:hypothetical protein